MGPNASSPLNGGPRFIAASLWKAQGNPGHLSAADRAQLGLISPLVRFRKREPIYVAGDPADAIFNIVRGVVKSYTLPPRGAHHIDAFLFPGDLAGLAQHGTYVNSGEAVTAVTAYRMPTVALEARLRRNPTLEFRFICKLYHDLRQTQYHAFLLSNQRVAVKLGLFLQMLAAAQKARGEMAREIYLPMSRSDIAAYIGTSLEAVSRAFQSLVIRGAIRFQDRRHVRILNRILLDSMISPAEVGRRSSL